MNKAVSEVHELCTNSVIVELIDPKVVANLGPEQGFSFVLPRFPKLRTSNYESGALTN